ncbi:AAA family ATPase [Streptomyces camelliae]|uniref:AAA family ATPase n=1 Tax=Streptomyces camelliae TaxID=3004093 RepID=A0ABY7PCF2_9ACTN|nr:AAA family ATPase [Streptomyces sp. HUAS 2-6]WBO67003.1 AAA family ATPase [Streptomyces sp. HUAS 2-6]
MDSRFLRLRVENFRTLTRMELPLGPLAVLVGPNAAGKSNVLRVFEFLADVARAGIEATLDARGGYEEIAYRGGDHTLSGMHISLEGLWSEHASERFPDEYTLSLLRRRVAGDSRGRYHFSRRERFVLHTEPGAESAFDLFQDTAAVDSAVPGEQPSRPPEIPRMATGLQADTLPLPAGGPSATAIRGLAKHLTDVRVFDADVRAARRPSPVGFPGQLLANDASNLADFLLELRKDAEAWSRLLEDVTALVPSVEDIDVLPSRGHSDRVGVQLKERNLRGRTSLADASFGTVRILCLLALLHDPNPPVLTCIEEIDHGLHPHALELVAERMREASERTQLIATTHAPVLVDQLVPEEVVICERDEKGASRIPATSTELIHEVVEASEGLPLGELWFSGALGGGR